MKLRKILVVVVVLAATGITGVASAPAAGANHALPPLNPAQIDYTPIGYYGPADEGGTSVTVPTPGDPSTGTAPGSFVDDPNPSGKFVAYDRNVWESLTMPSRHPGDNCNTLPANAKHPDCREGDEDTDNDRSNYTGPGGTSNIHGTCPPHPEFVPWGMCDNNQLEYLDYFENEMETEFADLGVTVKRYPFISPGTASRGLYLDASGGQAYNIAAVIPGADHPDETVIVGAHYDFTDSGPAAAWDSAEGHTEIMRMAWIMADYYRKTGTRPSATIKFVPWDSEESGTHGSRDYVANNIPPGEEDKVRAYFNVDPCAGAYPAFEEGTNRQVDQVLQLANPASFDSAPEVKARIQSFNVTAQQVIDQVLEHLDDSITRPAPIGEVPIFVSNAEATAGNDGTQAVTSSDRDKIATALGGLFLFGSDYSNFQAQGIPIFNFFPDYFGPHADGSPSDGGAKGLEILHTNNDNLTRINRLTSGLTAANTIDPTGNFVSEGWAKGMEFCAQVEAWGMLQPNAVGAQTANTDVVAYFEALPNEAIQNTAVTFDANGTYQYANAGTRAKQPDGALTYNWNFGDGTTGTGKVLQHAYAEIGRYNATLTVTGVGGSTDTMTIPIEVIGSNFAGPILDRIAPDDAADGNFELNWDFTSTRDGFQHFRVEESFDYRAVLADDATDLGGSWNASAPPAGLEPWQHSDSGTEKFHGNQFRSGPRSFWTGVTPENFQTFPPGGRSFMTLKSPISVPEGSSELTYWSLFQNQSVDSAQVQVALAAPGTAPEDLDWDTVDAFSDANNTCVGTNAAVLEPEFQHRRVDLSRFAGEDILVRFVYVLGASNPALSQPCGWYVDDIALFSGTFNPLAETTEEQYVVLDRPNLLWAYRVKGVYNDGITTAASNVEIANVTNSRGIPLKQLLRCLRIPGVHILGSVGKDRLIGTDKPEVLCGFAGKDTIKGRGGDDVVLAGKGKDKAGGGKGRDRLVGENGHDRLSGARGKDTLKGNKGRDRLNGGKGKDVLRGGKGKDVLRGGKGKDRCPGKGDKKKKC